MKDRFFLLNSLKFATKYSELILKQTATSHGWWQIRRLKTEHEHIKHLLAIDLLWYDGLETTEMVIEEIQVPLKKKPPLSLIIVVKMENL